MFGRRRICQGSLAAFASIAVILPGLAVTGAAQAAPASAGSPSVATAKQRHVHGPRSLSPEWISHHLATDHAGPPSRFTTIQPRFTHGGWGPKTRIAQHGTTTAAPSNARTATSGSVQTTSSTTTATTTSTPTAPFTECPAVGADSSCGLLVEITDSGATVYGDPTQGPYDGVEDTLIGVVNDSSRTYGAMALTSSTNLFGFDGDGICAYGAGSCGPTGYEGPNTSFSDISPDYTSGVVNFPSGLAPGASTYFSLEESLSTSNVTPGSGQSPVTMYEAGQAPNPREAIRDCPAGDPVNCASGVFWETLSDLSIPGRGPNLDLQRTYSSLLAGTSGLFGHGWASDYGMHLSIDSTTGDVTVHQENGSTVTFTPNGTGFTAPSRVQATLTQNADGSYTLTDFHGGMRHVFSAAGQLTSISDRNGETTSLSYSNGALATVTDPAGRTFTFTTDASGRVTSVSDPAGRTVGYSYDAAGDLVQVTDATGGVWQYGYDANHQLTSMTDPRGGTTSNVYDTSGRVVSQTDPAGHTTTWAYSGDPTTTSGSTTTITDPRGTQTVQSYQQLHMVSRTRAAGTSQAATTTYSYDPFTLDVASVTDPAGNTATFAWDRRGNMTSSTDALGRTTTYTWTGLNEPASVTDPAGNSTTFGYDSAGNLTSMNRSIGNGATQVTTYGHGDAAHPGDLTSMVDPDGHTWTMGYDAAGDVTAITDPLGEVTSYGYDQIGRHTSTTPARGNATGADPATFTTQYRFDAHGDVTKIVDPAGGSTTFGYDADHNRTSVTDPNGNTTTTSYNADNQPTKITRADGTTLSFGYDADGNQTSQTDGAGHTTSYSYDLLNQLTSTQTPAGATTSYGYDAAGNPTNVLDPTGQTTTNSYDAAGELTKTAYSDGTTPTVTYTYTADGQRASMSDGTGTTSNSYDGLNRLTAQTNGAGQQVGYGYDPAGHLTALTYPDGHTVSRGYDAAGRLASLTDWNGHTTSFTRNADGETTATQLGNGVTNAYGYDATDQMTNMTVTGPAGGSLAALSYTRDPAQQVASADPTGLPGTNKTYSYTTLEQLAGVNTNTYGYDAGDNLTQLLDGTTLGYNRDGQVTSSTPAGGTPIAFTNNANGDRTTGIAPDQTKMTYAYDQADRLTAATGHGAGATTAAGLIAAGEYHSLAVDDTGTVWSWGDNTYGQLGDGTTTGHTSPVKVTGLTSATQVTAGLVSSAALNTDGTVQAWGNNTYGQLGDGTTTGRTSPVKVTGLTGITQIAAGNYHVLALRNDGTVAAWGLNNAGQLGDGTTSTATSPVTVKGLTNVVQVAAGGLPGYAGHSVALTADGSVWTWGYGKSGQLGQGSRTSNPTPTKVTGLPQIVQVAANGDDTYAVGKDGSLWAWGDNSYGQMGNPNAGHTQDSPIQVNLTGVTQVAAGGTHVLALTSDGTAWGWGNDNTGQLGDGGACGKTCDTPVKITGLTNATALGGGYVHSLAALSDGTMRAWGRNAEGELGDGTTTTRATPVTVNGLSGIQPGTKTTYTYNGNGLRATRTSGQTTQTFAWDLAAPVPLLLTDGTTDYLYDDQGLPVEQVNATGTGYYSHDQYGSTRVLTDNTGAVTATFSYTPYGALTGKTGTADTPLRWNGQYQDSDTDLYYLRARYYDPTTGEFLTRDPLAALTQMAYGYAANNPLNLADPLGLDWYNPFSWSGRTWATVGVVAGGIALAATGVGVAVDAGAIAGASAETIGTVAGYTALTSGGVATATDAVPCVESFGSSDGPDGAACTGAVLGAVSLGYGAPGVFAPNTPRLVRGVLDAHALLFGYAGWTVDAIEYGKPEC